MQDIKSEKKTQEQDWDVTVATKLNTTFTYTIYSKTQRNYNFCREKKKKKDELPCGESNPGHGGESAGS